MSLTEWYYVAPPADLYLHVLSLFCTVTFFEDYVWRTTSKLSSEAKATISEQSDWVSESLDWSFKSFASLPSISGWVMTSMNKTQNATYYSFVPSSASFRVMLTSCDVTEQGSCPRMPLFTQFSCHGFLRLTSLSTSFWLKISLHVNVIDYYREETTSVSYFCLITRLPLF